MPADARARREDPRRLLCDLLPRYAIAAESSAAGLFLAYLELLEKWNRRINLVGSWSWGVLGLLFEEALWSAQYYPNAPSRHLDIGSGAGFPALLLRILRPGMSLELVESRARRAAFLEHAVAQLKLSGTTVYWGRLDRLLAQRQDHGCWNCYSWKGLRISRRDFSLLRGGAAPGARFWIYHGAQLPLEQPRMLETLELQMSEELPFKSGWHLSIYRQTGPPPVSRETIPPLSETP